MDDFGYHYEHAGGRLQEVLRSADVGQNAGSAGVGPSLEAWHWAQVRVDASAERLGMASEGLRLAVERSDKDLSFRMRRARVHDLLELGDADAARKEMRTILRSDGVRDQRLPWLCAMWAMLEGEFALAEQHVADGLSRHVVTRGASAPPPTLWAVQLFVLRREQGRLGEAEGVILDAIGRKAGAPAWRAARAYVAVKLAHVAEARADFDHLVDASGIRAPVDPSWLPAAAMLAEVCSGLDARRVASTVYGQMAPWRGRQVVVPPAAAYLGPADYFLGLLAATSARFDEAEMHFKEALEQTTRLGARPTKARVQVALAGLLLRRDEADDVVRARDLLAEARLAAGELGMGMLSREARLLAAAARCRPTEGSPAGSGGRDAARRRFTVRCFGGFELWVDGEPLHLRALKPKARSALRLLAMYAGRPVHREAIMEALWHDAAPAAATRSLQVVVSSLRQTLEPGVARGASSLLVREGEAYRLAVPSHGDCDVLRLERVLEDARAARARGDAAGATRALEAALDTYSGDLLPEEGPAEWVVKERERYRAAAVDAAHGLAGILLDRHQPLAAATVCERGLRIDRYRDELWRTLIRARDEAGNHMAARRARRDYDDMLADLGLG